MSMRPVDATGTVSSGRITKLMIGQGYGFIRLMSRREVFFHRSDLREGTSFNDLVVGHPVRFELVDDPISGARARNVRRSG
jgi:cold shock CspA family protein